MAGSRSFAILLRSVAITVSTFSWLSDFGPMAIGKVAVGESDCLFFKKIVIVQTQRLPVLDVLLDLDDSQSSFHSMSESGTSPKFFWGFKSPCSWTWTYNYFPGHLALLDLVRVACMVMGEETKSKRYHVYWWMNYTLLWSWKLVDGIYLPWGR